VTSKRAPPGARPRRREARLASQANRPSGSSRAALGADEPPDFAFGLRVGNYITEWAFDDRLVDVSDAIGHFSDLLFDPEALAWFVLVNERTGQKALYALPVGRSSYHIHVWKSLLERAGFTLEDIPRDWDPFWAFWCDEVQPAVRKALGRDDVWGAGLPMSAGAEDTRQLFEQFMVAYEANWVTPDGRLGVWWRRAAQDPWRGSPLLFRYMRHRWHATCRKRMGAWRGLCFIARPQR
jgi:ABC-type glycerol-3-phosphate transport system substrate-binding protein